jgi:hypothetical protein
MTLDKQKILSKIHTKADSMNISWDNDPTFMDWTQKQTGKRHLDALDIIGLLKVYLLISLGQYDKPLTSEDDLVLHRAISTYVSPKETEKVKAKMNKIYTPQDHKEDPRFVKLKQITKKIRNKINVQRIGGVK